jgi:16S rRNA (cytidine1402-2'-O)-methyltransferase
MAEGTLYIVSTPIGNMADITYRAVAVLGMVDLIAAEDTRRTRKLLSHYGIQGAVTSCFEQNEEAKARGFVNKLKDGASIALVSDAGTPAISDPGYRLVRLALEAGIPVVSVPGVSALLSVLSVSALPLTSFTFRGFVPTAKGKRRDYLLEMKGREETYVMYEAARRLGSTLKELSNLIPGCGVVVGREMTKIHEEVIRGSVETVLEQIEGRELKGEVTLVVRTSPVCRELSDLKGEIESLLRGGVRLKEAVKALAREFDISGSELYKEALKVQEEIRGE